MKKNKTLKRFLAFLLCAAMMVTYMPSSVYTLADDSAEATSASEPVEAAPAPETKAEPVQDQAETKSDAPETPVVENNDPTPEVQEEESPVVPEEETVVDESAASENDTRAGPDAEESAEDAGAKEEKDESKLNEEKLTFTGKANSVNVKVVAAPGTFPKGTTMKVTSVAKSEVRDAVESALDEVNDFRAVDITFYADGKEVQPKKNVAVKLSTSAFDTSEALNVVHVEDSGAAEVMNLTSASDTAAVFKTDGFSIYIVVETGEDARLNVKFVKADGSETTEKINKRQLDMIEKYIYDPGTGTLPADTMFAGWTTEQNYTAKTEAKTIADVRTDVAAKLSEAGFTDGTTITYYAMVFKPYSVTYKDERGKVITTEVVLARTTDTAPTHTITRDYTPYPPEEDGVASTFKGWQQLEPEVSGTEVLYQVNDSFNMEQTTYILQAKVEQGHWLSFDENLSNASYTEPVFVPTDSNPTRPTNPTRAGYTFDGWYTEDASSARDGQVAGSEFNFNQALTENKTVYAKWTVNTRANYSIIVWKQNVAGTGYDFAESHTLTGNIGATINTVDQNGSNVNTGTNPATARNARYYDNSWHQIAYTGFHCARYDQNVTITPEGTTVLNIYYDRNTITINFDAGYGSYILDEGDNTYKRRVTYTGLYEAPLSFTWPTTYYNNSSGTGGNNTLWETGNTTLTMIGAFKLPTNTDVSMDLTRTNAGTTPHKFYQMDVNGNYTDTPKDTIYAGNGTFTLTNKYTGFELDTYRRNGTGSWNTARDQGTVSSGYNQLEIRYKRVQKPITYLDGIYVDGSGAQTEQTSRGQLNQTAVMYYGTDVSSYGKGKTNYFVPEYNGYVFLGWFADSTCTQEYNFTTMPADGITVYAKWGVAEYTIKLHGNDSTADPIQYAAGESQATKFWVDDGEKIGNVGGERIYYDLVGWYTDEGFTHPYNFDAYRVNKQTVGTYGKLYSASEIDPEYPTTIGELNLYAKWRSKLIGSDGIEVVYVPGEGTCGTDENKYADQSEAVAIGAATPTDTANYVFSHWEVQKWNGSNWVLDTKVFPGDNFDVLAANAKIVDKETGEVVALGNLDKNKQYTYTIQVNAVYVEKDKEVLTFINWYNNYDGGIVDKSENIKINEAVPVPAAPTRTGYKFLGWIKGIEEDGTTTTLTDLYITYDNETKTYSTDVADALTPVQVAADENLVGDGTQHNAMYAKWEAIKYNIEFDKNADDATGTTAKMENLEFDKDYNLTANGFTREGYVFKGWSDKATDKTPKYTDKQSVKNLAKTDGETVTLYAIWLKKAVVNPSKTNFGLKNLTSTTADNKGHEFSFTLAAGKEGNPMPSSATAKVSYEAGKTGEQKIPFGEIAYDAAGTYEYTITEDTKDYTADKGWKVTNNGAKVTVVVAENNGELTATVTPATITNAYTPEQIEVDPTTTKKEFGKKNLVSTTQDGKGHDFKFTLAAKDNAPMPAANTATVQYAAGATGEETIPFGKITYKAAGTYKYTITEDTEDYPEAKGWTVDNNGAEVTVVIKDNGDGTLSVESVATQTIKNEYKVKQIEVDPTTTDKEFGKKNLTATTEDGKGHDFKFTLAAKDNAPMPANAEATVSYAANKTGMETIPFGKITYKAAGTYKYTITEDTKDYTADNGWTVTNNGAEVTVVIEDKGDGTLAVKSVDTKTIINGYNVKDIPVDPTSAETTFGKKNLVSTTKDGKGHDFKFTLAAVTEGAPMPENAEATVSYAADKTGVETIPFGTITYKKAGTYKYTITEDTKDYTAAKGWTVTDNGATVTVVIEDKGNGTLAVKSVDTQTIKNEYKVKEITVDPSDAKTTFGKKNLASTTEDGKGHEFSFTLAGTSEGAPMPEAATAKVSYAADKTGVETIPFGKITYNAAGTYTYTITEDVTDYTEAKGWTVTDNGATVTVKIKDNGDGTLSVDSVDTKTIKNEYKTEDITVDPKDAKTTFGKKNLVSTTQDGKGHDFTFTLAKQGDAPMPEANNAKVSYAAGKTGEETIPFGTITYTKAGTYKYTITEDTTDYPEAKGWTVTDNGATVTVKIKDNGDGTLSVESVDTKTIKNEYKVKDITVDPSDAETTFGKKNLASTTEDGKGHDFKFTLAAATEGAPMPASAEATVKYAAGKTGEETIPFGKIKFTAAGEYKYTITEDVTDYTAAKGWTVTDNGATVTVKIKDNGDGTLSVDSVDTKTIKNEYKTKDITVDPKDAKTTFGKKNLTATTEDGKGHDFSFTLAKQGDAPMPKDASAKVSYAAGKTGEQTIPFGEITYSKTGTYTYTITEADPGKGWTVTGNNATVTVTITDNGDGTLKAEVKTATIANKYEVGEITVDPKDAKTTFGKKNVTAAAADGKAKTFNFTLEAVTEGAPMPKDAKASLEYAAGATGEKTIPFGEITYTKAGDYTYKITEADAGKGWTTTGSGTEITVTVTDNGDGTLSAAIDKTVEIENKYAVEDITVDPTDAKTTFGKKNVTETTEDGKAKTFNFTLEAVTKDAPMPKDAKASLEYAAGATGAKTIPFGEITYSAAGEYEYKITEADPGKGWTVSNNGASVIVKITDNGDGTLSAAVEKTPEIKNGYKVDEITVDPTNDKTTFGKKNVTATTADGKGHEFNFTLEAVTAGASMPKSAKASVSYDAAETGAKKIPFGEITYTKAGDYTYKITEADAGKGWTTTGNGAEVTVSVTDNGDGTMSAEVKTTPEIKNEYAVEEIKVDPKDAKTTFGKKDVKATTEDGKGHEFSFTLAKDGEAPMPASADAKVSYEADETGVKTIPFGEITYAAAGEYKYTITEADAGKGWTTKGNGATVTIVIKDNGDGTLRVDSVDTKTVENKYAVEELIVDPTDAEAKTEFGKKNVTATTEDGKGKTFNFTLAKKGDAPMPTSEEASVSYEAGKTGEKTIPFGKITYTKPGEYKYTITEAAAGGGWTTEGNKAEVVVTVTDNGDGTMSAVAETQTITNSYAVEPLVVDPTDAKAGTEFGKKNVTATTEDGKGKTFNFTLAKDGEAPMPESAEAGVSYKAGETGEQTIPFGKITYTKPGEYKYTITEAEAGKGWTTTGNDAEVTVTVVDNGDGTMTASVAETAVVENSYKAEPAVVDDKDEEGNPIVTKIVEGEGFDATEFKFSIAAETAGAPLPEPAEGTVTAEEAGEFVVDFGAITFEKAGTYVYTIKETTEAPSRDWTCDNTEKTVRVVVTDDGEGQLHAKVEGVEVTNTYVELVDIIYHLNGGNWHGDPSDIVETYPVDTWIKIHAKPVRKGYKFVEWRGSSYQPGDDYHVMAHHEFVAIWEKEGGGNHTPDNGPDTGDHNGLGGLIGLFGASMAGLFAMLFRRRREQE